MNRLAVVIATIAVAALPSSGALAQTNDLNAPDRFAFGGPDDASYRLYDGPTGKLVAKTDADTARIFVLPRYGSPNAYLVLGEGWEFGWEFTAWKITGTELERIFHTDNVNRQFDVQDLNGDGELDFTFDAAVNDDFDTAYGTVAQRDYVSGASGYRVEIPACGSARNALNRQRLAYVMDRNNRSHRPDREAAKVLQAELKRLTDDCPAK